MASTKSITQLVDEIIADGKMTTAEKDNLFGAMMADGKLDDEENAQIIRIKDLLAKGELKVED